MDNTEKLQKIEEELKIQLDEYVSVCDELDLDPVNEIERLIEDYLSEL